MVPGRLPFVTTAAAVDAMLHFFFSFSLLHNIIFRNKPEQTAVYHSNNPSIQQDHGTTMILLKLAATLVFLHGTQRYGMVTVNAADTFNYYGTDLSKRTFGPALWRNVTCNNVETCPGWPTNWEDFNPWLPYSEMKNQCLDCSKIPAAIEGVRACRAAIQSPINLERKITNTSSCLDRHRMNYVRGNCPFNKMDFQILPHVLRAYQPPSCDIEPTIDYSRGYPVPWRLEFTDISVPSQHKQDGRRYDAEVMLHHTYGANGFDRLLGNVAIFLVKGTDNDHYDFLELYLRQWAQVQLQVNTDCADRRRLQTTMTTKTAMLEAMLEIDGVDEDDNDLEDELFEQGWKDLLMKDSIEVPFESDLPLGHDEKNNDEQTENAATNDKVGNHRDLGQIFAQRQRPRPTKSPTRSPAPSATVGQVLDFKYYNRIWHPYDWLEKCKTEYYFKYLGSLVEPPCIIGVHWRIMKNPIKISPRQLRILENLIARRQDPITCKENSTVGKPRVNVTSKVDVNRPLQLMQARQYLEFCECVDWNSSFIEDMVYCSQTMAQRGVYPRKEPPSVAP